MIKIGIILAGGSGTRMSPLTKAVNKQLLPIYDKPLIFYPLSVLMLSGIRDILIIVNKGQINQIKKILPNGNNLGIKISYAEQDRPKGLPDAFIVGKNFIGKNSVALILGDNFFYGESLTKKFTSYGIKNNRIILEYSESRASYLASYNKVDISLDSFPYPGGTVSIESLWMGVPVITLAGERLLSNQGKAILMNIGLKDWISKN